MEISNAIRIFFFGCAANWIRHLFTENEKKPINDDIIRDILRKIENRSLTILGWQTEHLINGTISNQKGTQGILTMGSKTSFSYYRLTMSCPIKPWMRC